MSSAFLFPGQGSQSIGMGLELAQNFKQAKAVFDEVDDALSQSLSRLMWEGTDTDLMLTSNAQPALMAVSLAVMRVLEEEAGFHLSRQARFVAGHSLGEYSALAAAGSLSLSDTARLLRIRGNAMQEAVPVGQGAMAAILGLEFDEVSIIARDASRGQVCEAANDNGGAQVVVSGHKLAVERAIELAQKRGAKRALLLPVSAPFHCSLMTPAQNIMRDALKEVAINKPVVPLVANIHAKAITDPDQIRDGLVEQVTGTVRWRESMMYLREQGVVSFYEAGAGKVLSGLVKRVVSGSTTTSIGTKADIVNFIHSKQDVSHV